MKGKSYRQPAPAGKIRIIHSITDSTADEFIDVSKALPMIAAKELKKVNVGNDYPDSFRPA